MCQVVAKYLIFFTCVDVGHERRRPSTEKDFKKLSFFSPSAEQQYTILTNINFSPRYTQENWSLQCNLLVAHCTGNNSSYDKNLAQTNSLLYANFFEEKTAGTWSASVFPGTAFVAIHWDKSKFREKLEQSHPWNRHICSGYLKPPSFL